MPPTNTKKQLLDVAEELFALKGYANTSLRAITGRAGVNLAAVSYHFGSKEGLMEAVLERRLLPLNHLRRKRLEEMMAKAAAEGRAPSPAEVLRAFVEPTLAFSNSGSGARSFICLISRALSDPDPTVRAHFLKHIRPLFEFFSQCLAAALPGLDQCKLFWRTHFILGSLAHVLHGLDKPELFPPEMIPDTPGAVADLLVAFLAAGVEAQA